MKKARVHISMDKPVLDKIEKRSKELGITVSAWIQMLAIRHFRRNERIENGL